STDEDHTLALSRPVSRGTGRFPGCLPGPRRSGFPEDEAAGRPGVPGRCKPGDPIVVLGREGVKFGSVRLDVVQLPGLPLSRHQLPAPVADRTIAFVLPEQSTRFGGFAPEGWREAPALHRQDLPADDCLWVAALRDVHAGGHHVDDMADARV